MTAILGIVNRPSRSLRFFAAFAHIDSERRTMLKSLFELPISAIDVTLAGVLLNNLLNFLV